MGELGTNDFLPTANLANLRLRAEFLRRVRAFFDARGFVEVETPLLSADAVVDLHVDPIPVTLPDSAEDVETGRAMWLQTSPEFGMKRLLAAGLTAIYQVTRAFRIGEIGRLHNPEFTIVEWYRAGDNMQSGMQLLSDWCVDVMKTQPAVGISYAQAFQAHTAVDPHVAPTEQLLAACRQRGLAIPDGIRADDRDAWLDLLLTECVEPHLGRGRPAILFDYPASQAALARVRDATPPVAERFELYLDGIELANGYHELLDPRVLRSRNRAANEARARAGKFTIPEESRLLAAMEHGLPACCGVALGLDRVLMLAARAAKIQDVLTFPIATA